MSRVARLPAIEAATDAGDEPETAIALNRVVQLFARAGDGPPPDAVEALSQTELDASLDLIRRVAGGVRALQEHARTVVRDSRQAARAAAASAQTAQVRANEAEGRARSAMAEAERAQAKLGALSAKLAAAEARAAQAEARAEEAQLWLRRLHDCMAGEFTALTVAPI